ncbi:MAG: hypothetical protein PHI98_03045 [Eubacteriales bacterium]|nr:hypothetical protein [Eubacteriales bacterium]
MPKRKTSEGSVILCNASILLYLFWLLLPAVQTTGRAAFGCLTVLLFAVGVALDWEYVKKSWLTISLRALCAALTPVALYVFLERGGTGFAGFYVQNVMFWFPLVYCAYARERNDPRLWRYVKPLLLTVITVTTLTTIGWLIQGMLRGGRVYAYSRSLGSAEPGREAYLKELMLRNIGGYDFVYATVIALPLTCIGIQACRGWKRVGFIALCCAQAVMVVLSQYTYAMVFTAILLAVEIIAWLSRLLWKVKPGISLLIGVAPLLLVWFLREPLVGWAAALCEQIGFTNFSFSLKQLLVAMEGGVTDEASRLGYYLIPLKGIAQAPLFGTLFGGEKLLSQHSDVLDLLSGMGIIGTALMGGSVWLMGRGCLQGVMKSPYRAQLLMMAAALFATATLGTAVYSRDIMAVAAMGVLLVLGASKRIDNPPCQ